MASFSGNYSKTYCIVTFQQYLIPPTYHLAQINITSPFWKGRVQRDSSERRGKTGSSENRVFLLWNLLQREKLHGNENYLHHYYFLEILGSLLTKASFSVILLLFGIMKTLKFIYTFSSCYKEYHLLLSLCGWFILLCYLLGLRGKGGRNSNAEVSCFSPSDSWHVVWQHKGKEERLHIKIFWRHCCQTYRHTTWIIT